MVSTLIWSGVTLILGLTAIFCLGNQARQALRTWSSAVTATTAERDAAVEETLVSIGERRVALKLRESLLDDETTAERARLQAEAALHETHRQAAAEVLEEAIEAKRKVIAARAEAEAALAPELLRKSVESPSQEWLMEAYDSYCDNCTFEPMPFGQWIQGYQPA